MWVNSVIRLQRNLRKNNSQVADDVGEINIA